MRFFVISLSTSTKRREVVQKQLSAAGIEFEFLDGVDGREGKHPLLKRFRPTEFLIRHGRPSLPGEAGCYASHFLAWQKCVELNQSIIIFEDDFLLAETPLPIFELATTLSEQYGFVRLEPAPKNLGLQVWSDGTHSLKRFIKVPQCLTCYAISPGAAKGLIAGSEKFILPVDYFTRHTHLHHVPIYGLTPTPVFRREDSDEISVIGNRHRNKGPIWCKITRLLFRLSNLFLNSIENIKFFFRDLLKSKYY